MTLKDDPAAASAMKLERAAAAITRQKVLAMAPLTPAERDDIIHEAERQSFKASSANMRDFWSYISSFLIAIATCLTVVVPIWLTQRADATAGAKEQQRLGDAIEAASAKVREHDARLEKVSADIGEMKGDLREIKTILKTRSVEPPK